MQYGCLARYFNKYAAEVAFARKNGFAFLQLWYDNHGLQLQPVEAILPAIAAEGFPAIVHAVLAADEISTHLPELKKILRTLKHDELIIHPLLPKKQADGPLQQLTEALAEAQKALAVTGVKLYIENNSRLEPLFCDATELEYLFSRVPAGFLLDIAHVDNYDHLRELIAAAQPEFLHIADRNFTNVHEHLPLGQGEIDYERVFREYLPEFDGKIVFEITQSDTEIIEAKKLVERIFANNARQRK